MSADKEKQEKAKISSQIKHVPKDAQVIMSILKELNVQDYEPRVINQLLEFTYRYVTCILDDAKVFANHARKKTIELEDVKLATQVVLDKSFTGPPPRHVLARLAESRNSMPLPAIKPQCGLRLPPDRYCLIACNYKLRASNPPKKMVKSALESRSTLKTQFKGTTAGVSGGPKRTSMMPAKQQTVNIPKPVLKFTTTPKTIPVDSKMDLGGDGVGDMKMEVDMDAVASASAVGSIEMVNDGSLKRERDDDDFEVV